MWVEPFPVGNAFEEPTCTGYHRTCENPRSPVNSNVGFIYPNPCGSHLFGKTEHCPLVERISALVEVNSFGMLVTAFDGLCRVARDYFAPA